MKKKGTGLMIQISTTINDYYGVSKEKAEKALSNLNESFHLVNPKIERFENAKQKGVRIKVEALKTNDLVRFEKIIEDLKNNGLSKEVLAEERRNFEERFDCSREALCGQAEQRLNNFLASGRYDVEVKPI